METKAETKTRKEHATFGERECTLFVHLDIATNPNDLVQLTFDTLLNGEELHELVWDNKPLELTAKCETLRYNLDATDLHGNTPMTLAVMLHHVDCVKVLLTHGALITRPNTKGWTSMSEAVSYGDRDLIKLLFHEFTSRATDELHHREGEIHEKINKIGDVTLIIDWKISSWLPIGRFLPSDRWIVRKKGTSVRIDMTLSEFENLNWVRGDMSFLFHANLVGKNRGYLLDNVKKIYRHMDVDTDTTSDDIDLELNRLMSTPVKSATSPGQVKFTRAKSGVYGFRKDKVETVNSYNNCRVYHVKNINWCMKTRLEHLSEEALKKYKEDQKVLRNPTLFNKRVEKDVQELDEAMNAMQEHKDDPNAPLPEILKKRKVEPLPSLPPPPKNLYTKETYFCKDEAGEAKYPNIHLGRPMDVKADEKQYTAGVSMCDNFPLTTQEVINILDIAAPHNNLVRKLKEFLTHRLPPGFPVKLTFPVLPTISATMSFVDYDNVLLDENLFMVPVDYKLVEE